MSVPGDTEVIVLRQRPGETLRPGDLVSERRPLRPPAPGEVIVRNLVTSVDPVHLRMLRGTSAGEQLAIGEPVPANSVGIVAQSEDPAVPVGTQVVTYTGWQAYATTAVAPTEVADRALGGPLEWVSVLSTTGVTAYVGDGVDLFFDNVGGRQLTLALSVMNNYGNVVLCGSVSGYARADDPDAGADLGLAVFKRITLRGFIVSDFNQTRLLPIRAELAALVRDKKLRVVVSEFDGLERAPEALATVFERGSRYIGRRVVRIAEE